MRFMRAGLPISVEPRTPRRGEVLFRTMDSRVPTTGREYTDEEIRSFVEDLESLPGGDLTVALLVGCGQRAVAPLRDFLLNGKPRGVFQPRQHAVEALGQLAAKEVLMEYLFRRQVIPDAVVRFGEEAVESTAARELARWHTEEVFQFLLELGKKRMLAGVVDAVGEFDRPEAIAVLLKALEDDVCRPIAEEAVRRIAARTKPQLFRTARAESKGLEEKPSELQKRRSVVRILSELEFSEAEWGELRPLLEDRDEEIAMMVAEIAVDWAPAKEKETAAQSLVDYLGRAHWFMQIRIQDCFCRNYPQVREVLEKASAQRRRRVQGNPLADPVFRMLERVQSKAEKFQRRENASA